MERERCGQCREGREKEASVGENVGDSEESEEAGKREREWEEGLEQRESVRVREYQRECLREKRCGGAVLEEVDSGGHNHNRGGRVWQWAQD